MSTTDLAELRDQIAGTIHRRICEHSREDCIENLGNCERATDSAMPLISTALDEGNVLARLLSGALNDAIRTLRELAEKAAGEPIPFDDVDLYAEMVDGALDAAADAAARPAETVAAILDRHETPDVAELRRLVEAANREAVTGPTYERDWPLSSRAVERFPRAMTPDVVLGPLDQLARIDAILARSDHLCEPSFCDWKRDIWDIREVRGL